MDPVRGHGPLRGFGFRLLGNCSTFSSGRLVWTALAFRWPQAAGFERVASFCPDVSDVYGRSVQKPSRIEAQDSDDFPL